MATAANSVTLQPKTGDPTPGAATSAADLFAALIAGIAPGKAAPVEGEASGEGTIDGSTDEALPDGEDVSILLPMLDQQRAALAAPVIVQAATAAPTPVTVEAEAISSEKTAAPAITSKSASPATKPEFVPTAPAAVAIAPDAKAVLTNSAATAVITPAATASETAKPVTAAPAVTVQTATVAETPKAITPEAKTPVARPIAAAAQGTSQPETVAVAKPVDGRVAPTPIDLALNVVQGAPVPATTTQVAAVVQANVQAAPAEQAPPATTTVVPAAHAAAQVETPAPVATAVAAQAAPVIANPAAPQRPVRAAATTEKTIEALQTKDAAPAQPIAQAIVQPIADTIFPTFQPAAAPALGTAAVAAPAPNVGAEIAAQVLDLSKGGQWIDQLARDISQAGSKDGIMRFALTPESLGELKVEITHSDRGAHVRMLVGSEAAQQALTDAQPKLASEARAQGVRIAETEISFTNGQAQSQGREPGRQQAEANQTQTPRMVRGGSEASSINHVAAAPTSRPRTDRYA